MQAYALRSTRKVAQIATEAEGNRPKPQGNQKLSQGSGKTATKEREQSQEGERDRMLEWNYKAYSPKHQHQTKNM